MNRIIKILLLLILAITGCESEEILIQEIQYREKIVVQSEIISNSKFTGVRITKTLPIGVPFTIETAEIKNASVYLRIDFVKIIPLHYDANGIYKPLYDLYVSEGEHYELFGEADNKRFYAITKIPLSPQIESTSFNYNGYFAAAMVQAKDEECYAALWTVDDGLFKSAPDYFEVITPAKTGIGNFVQVRSSQFPVEYQNNQYNGKRYIKVFALDQSFSTYFYTKSGNQSINNPYVQGVGETVWNVIGEDVIGMFIGLSKGSLILVN